MEWRFWAQRVLFRQLPCLEKTSSWLKDEICRHVVSLLNLLGIHVEWADKNRDRITWTGCACAQVLTLTNYEQLFPGFTKQLSAAGPE